MQKTPSRIIRITAVKITKTRTTKPTILLTRLSTDALIRLPIPLAGKVIILRQGEKSVLDNRGKEKNWLNFRNLLAD
jgi:hypothetical protein